MKQNYINCIARPNHVQWLYNQPTDCRNLQYFRNVSWSFWLCFPSWKQILYIQLSQNAITYIYLPTYQELNLFCFPVWKIHPLLNAVKAMCDWLSSVTKQPQLACISALSSLWYYTFLRVMRWTNPRFRRDQGFFFGLGSPAEVSGDSGCGQTGAERALWTPRSQFRHVRRQCSKCHRAIGIRLCLTIIPYIGEKRWGFKASDYKSTMSTNRPSMPTTVEIWIL